MKYQISLSCHTFVIIQTIKRIWIFSFFDWSVPFFRFCIIALFLILTTLELDWNHFLLSFLYEITVHMIFKSHSIHKMLSAAILISHTNYWLLKLIPHFYWKTRRLATKRVIKKLIKSTFKVQKITHGMIWIHLIHTILTLLFQKIKNGYFSPPTCAILNSHFLFLSYIHQQGFMGIFSFLV